MREEVEWVPLWQRVRIRADDEDKEREFTVVTAGATNTSYRGKRKSLEDLITDGAETVKSSLLNSQSCCCHAQRYTYTTDGAKKNNVIILAILFSVVVSLAEKANFTLFIII